MSPGEVAARLSRILRSRIEAAGLLTVQSVPEPRRSIPPRTWIAKIDGQGPGRYRLAAEQILDGEISLFSRPVTALPGLTRWNRDPLTGRDAPVVFGKLIDYRDESVVGNIKYLWELNRHLELVTLAQAFALTDDERYLQGIRAYLESWLEQCPYPCGVNWTSSLELGIRLINWSVTWQLIGQEKSRLFENETGAKLRESWLRSVYQHVHFIHHYYSRHSSANNHLIGEAAGVFIACCTWPHWGEFSNWGKRARQILIDESANQTHADGVNREQAISYQQFVLDFLILAALAGRANEDHFPAEYWRTIERMLEFIQSIMDIGGNVPMFGDADDGYVVKLSQEPDFCPYRSLLATGAVLFDRPDFAAASHGLDDKTRMLVPTKWQEFRKRGQVEPVVPAQAFANGGYFILGTSLGLPMEVRLIADAGPLGYLSIAAHGHADALAIVLSVAGHEILIDPGTYAYHTKPVWREYFRGTGAHNTVRVDGLDQSVQAGNFMWLRHADARCLEHRPAEDGGTFAGEHDGYRRLRDPVTHQRKVRMQANVIEVTDRLLCEGAHEVERCWHFSEHCHVTLERDLVVAESGPVRVTLRAAEPVREVCRLRGSENPAGGWVSRHFDVKVASDSIYFLNDIRGTCELRTLIQWEISGKESSNED